MQVSVETTSGLERRLTIAIPAGDIQKEVDKRIQKAAPNVKLDGFRQGKVPVKVVRQRFGDSIRQEVLGEMMSSSFQEAVSQEKLRPAGQPSVEPKEMDPKKDFSFIATFEIYPEINLSDLSGVSISKPVTDITDADVETMIETLRKQQAQFEDVDKAAEDGDQVNIDFEGFKDDEPFEGGKAEGSNLTLGSGSMIPGFEDGLLGAQAGDEKVLNLTFPEDYHAEELKGAAVVFNVKVNAVQEQNLPAIDAEFMKKFGVEDGEMATLKAEIEKNMQRELKAALKNRLKQQVMDGVLEKNDIEVPSALVDNEVNVMRQQMFQQFGGGQAMENFDTSMLPAELFSEQATRRVSLGLLLSKAIEDNDIKPSEDEVRAAIEEIASAYEVAQEVIDYYYNNQQQLQQVEAMVLEDKVVDVLLASADVSDENLGYEELMKLVSAQQQ
jgi:trigger factor